MLTLEAEPCHAELKFWSLAAGSPEHVKSIVLQDCDEKVFDVHFLNVEGDLTRRGSKAMANPSILSLSSNAGAITGGVGGQAALGRL